MDVLELLKRLSYGELSGLAVGGDGAGVIPEDTKPRIIAYANEALLRLHSRFMLRENLVMIKQVEHLTYYYLLKRFARSQIDVDPTKNPPHSYILDSVEEPFQDDVIKILGVTDHHSRPMVLNDTENGLSLFTPQPNLLQIPSPLHDDLLAITYQARHPQLEYEHPDFGCQLIDLPYTLEGALTAYIAYKVFSHMNGQENAAKANEHMQVYEGICAEVTQMDLVSQTQIASSCKFRVRGFR